MDEALDLENLFDIAATIEALAGSALVGLELGELGLPKAQDIGLEAADPCDIANLEVEAVGDDGRLDGTLMGKLCGHGCAEQGHRSWVET